MQSLSNPSRLHRLVSWAKAPASLAQSAAFLLLLSAGATAAWMPPQARHALAQRVEVAAHLPALPALFHAAPPAAKRSVVATLPPLLSQKVLTQSNAQVISIGGRPTFVVTSTGDGDVDPAAPPGTCITTSANGANCTLRAAIEVANASRGATINFNIPGGGVQTIAPATQLPNITVPVTINGYSPQMGASANTLTVGDNAKILVEINEANAGASGAGLLLSAGSDGSSISGLAINRVGNGSGIQLFSTSADTIATKSNQIVDNLASGNSFAGVEIDGPQTTGTSVQNNKVGTDASGTTAIPNAVGVQLIGSTGNAIGGTSAGQGNVISGNTGVGLILNSGSNSNTIQGNLIGTDVTGLKALGNGIIGVGVNNATNNDIFNNTITSATSDGIFIGGGSSTGTIIQINRIGVGSDGTTPLPNAGNGIHFFGAAPGHTVGDPLPASAALKRAATVAAASGLGNIIANNGGAGVSIELGGGQLCHRKSILGNSIYGNKKLGIDLNGDGITQNQPVSNQGDTKVTGPNALQNYPILSSATVSGGNVTIAGTLTSAPNAMFRIEFFSNPAPDTSTHGQGQTLLGFQNVATDASGNAKINATLPVTGTNTAFAATATDAVGNTSEFSTTSVASQPAPPVATTTTVTSSSPGNSSQVGQTVTFTARAMAGAGQFPSGTITFFDGTTMLGTGVQTDGPAPTFSTSTLSAGTHSITATYTPAQGSNFTGSTSNTLTQTVMAPTTTSNTLSINDVTVAKPASGTGTLLFTVTLSSGTSSGGKRKTPIVKPGKKLGKAAAPSTGYVMVIFVTIDGSAKAGTDYQTTTGTLAFSAGETQKTISVPILGGAGNGVPKTFTVFLDGAQNATITKGTGTITSVAPVSPNVVVMQSASAPSVPGGGQVTFNLTVQNTGTASAPDVVVFDTLPTGATLVSSAPSATQSGQTLTFSLGALAAGATKTLSVVVLAPNAPTTLVNTSTASATGLTGTQSAPSTRVQRLYNLSPSL